jgi:predicted metal-dependent hydrolase
MLKVVRVSGKPAATKLIGNRLEVQTQSGEQGDIRGRIRAWYRVKGRDYLARRIDALSRSLPWVHSAPPFRLLEMSRQWGSCSPAGEIILNPHLIKAPRPCIDYVLIHELAHLKHHDHGTEFWKLIDAHAGDWRKAKHHLDGLVEVLLVD